MADELAWSGAGGEVWTAVVVLVMAVGSVTNVAVMLQWIFARTPHDSLTVALPLADLMVCLFAAPFRYAQTYSLMRPEEQHIYNSTIGRTELGEPTSNLTYVDGVHSCYEGWCEVGRLVVVALCVGSLHVVVVVALHRLTLLLQLSPTLPPSHATAVFVAVVALAVSIGLVGGLHSITCFMRALPLLGECGLLLHSNTPPMSVVAFLGYLGILCSFSLFCYLVIMAALLHQGCTRPSYTSSAVVLPREQGEGATGLSGQERALQACATVLMVVVTLVVCWMMPVFLTLYALLVQPSLIPTLPYSDALILLSALVHPFVYRDGWSALLACFNRLYALFFTAEVLDISHRLKVQTITIGMVQEQEEANKVVGVIPSIISSSSSVQASHLNMPHG